MAGELSIRADGRAEAMYSGRAGRLNPPWHDLGVQLDRAATSADLARPEVLGWSVEKQPLLRRRVIQTPEGEVFSDIEVDTHFATVRTDTNAQLGVVTSGYKVIQNSEAFGFLDSLLMDGIMEYEAAGALRGGRMIWLLARLPSVDHDTVAAGDNLSRYILMLTAHDGSSALRILPTAVRVVCMNTVNLALRMHRKHHEAFIALRHSGDLNGKLNAARTILAGLDRQFTGYSDTARRLAEKKAEIPEVVKFINDTLPPLPDEPSDKERKDRDQARRDIFDLFFNERQRIVANTWWAAYNAVTEWADHKQAYRGKDEQRKRENRMLANLGVERDVHAIKEAALDQAARYAGLATV
jgi:phage/plasmid-like protein (TIGR03299 family)